MPRFLLILYLLMSSLPILAQSSGADGVGDDYAPQAGNGGYDVLHYDLNLAWDDTTDILSGTTTITALATQDLSAFNLDFIGLEVNAIQVNDEPAEFSREGQELTVMPASALNTDDTFTVAVTYSGVPMSLTEPSLLFTVGWQRTDYGVFVGPCCLMGSATWFPGNHHVSDKATYTIRMTVPAPLMVVANGTRVDTIDNGNTITYHYEMPYPMPSISTIAHIGDFVAVEEESVRGVSITHYFLAKDAQALTLEVVGRVGDMLVHFEDTFGDYPFDSYGIVVIPELGRSAFESQSLSTHGPDSLDERTVAHELAHQWFAASVSQTLIEETWLGEGFATYAERLWLEYLGGFSATDLDAMPNYYSIFGLEPPGLVPPDDLYNSTVYFRGAWVLHALRLRVGEDIFFQILRTYAEQYQYGNASEADFIALAEDISGQNLGDFFDAWLNQDGLPPVPKIGLGA